LTQTNSSKLSGIASGSILDQVIVSIDLETTGVDPSSDAIIEVGAVKFRGNEELGQFSSVINPHRKLSDFIVGLTGISQEDVDRGAEWERVRPMLTEFIGSNPILGHNVGFDAAFLRNNGVTPKNGAYDTSEMARIAMPEGPLYGLGRLSEQFKFAHDNPHRALSDAMVTRDLFLMLMERFESMDAGTLEVMRRLGLSSSWSVGTLAAEILESMPADRRRASTGPMGLNLKELSSRLRTKSDGSVSVAPAGTDAAERNPDLASTVAEVFAEGGVLSGLLPGHEPREQQVEMAQAVATAISEGNNLIVEAGTGVGKSLAYLVPAALHATRTRSRVIVSTNTINLQEQLVQKDLGIVANVLQELEPGSKPLKSAPLKGRANYLCFRRWSHAVTTAQPDQREASVLGKLLVWLQDTKDGDRSELALGRDRGMFNRYSAQGAAGCPPQDGPCFLRRARSEAATSDVVVINHAMLMSDIAMGGGLLPEHDVLIVDEAHHIQDAATRHLGISVRQNQLAADLAGALGDNGAIASYSRILQAASADSAALNPFPQMTAESMAATDRASGLASECFAAIASFADFIGRHTMGNDVRLTDAVRDLEQWSTVAETGQNLVTALAETAVGMTRLLARKENIDSGNIDEHATVLDLSAVLESVTEAHEGLRQALVEPEQGFVYWMTVIGGGRAVEVHGAPLDVSPMLRDRLFERDASVILTGATLSYAGNFERITGAIGLDDAGELSLGSPFDYKQAALVAVPEDISEPGGSGYAQGTAEAIASVARGVRGRTLALFTSNSALESARRVLVETLSPLGIKVIGQGHDGPPQRIMQNLAEENDVVALGVSSLWEGADLKGAGLDALVMARLPFPVPSDPVFSARSELFEDGFNEYAVPEAVLRFRQGFGRLIRSKTDRGIFVILDRRVLTKGYGRSFQRALPKSTVRRTTIEDLESLSRSWKNREEL
jgi:DNA polymerase-3 subunit epsilon/ATP-dependent DNA helicase DinG